MKTRPSAPSGDDVSSDSISFRANFFLLRICDFVCCTQLAFGAHYVRHEERERESCWQLALNQGMDEANEDSDDDGDDQKEMYAAQCTVYTLDWVPLHVENETRSMVGKRGTTNWNKSH